MATTDNEYYPPRFPIWQHSSLLFLSLNQTIDDY